MKYNFTYEYLYDINSDWFENKDSLYGKIGCKAFLLFLTLFRFKVPRQEVRHQFITSIALLRRCTNWSSQDILDMLLKLKRYNMISIDGHSRTEYFYDENKKIKDKECLIIVSDCNKDNWDNYIPVDFNMVQHYLDYDLNENYIGLYCLLRKLSNNNIERKSYMSIEKMAAILHLDKDTVHKMIYELNKRYLLFSWKVRVKDQDGNKTKGKLKRDRFEHRLCYNYETLGQFIKEHKDKIDKNMKRWRRGD